MAKTQDAITQSKAVTDIKQVDPALKALQDVLPDFIATNEIKSEKYDEYLFNNNNDRSKVSAELDASAQIQICYRNNQGQLRVIAVETYAGYKSGIGGKLKGAALSEILKEVREEFLLELEDFLNEQETKDMIAEYKLDAGKIIVGDAKTEVTQGQVLLRKDQLLNSIITEEELRAAISNGTSRIGDIEFTTDRDENGKDTPRFYVISKTRIVLDVPEEKILAVMNNINKVGKLLSKSFAPIDKKVSALAKQIKEMASKNPSDPNLNTIKSQFEKLLKFKKRLSDFTEVVRMVDADPTFDIEIAAKAKVFQRLLLAENPMQDIKADAKLTEAKKKGIWENQASSIARKGFAFRTGPVRGALLKDVWKDNASEVNARADEMMQNTDTLENLKTEFASYKEQLIAHCAAAEINARNEIAKNKITEKAVIKEVQKKHYNKKFVVEDNKLVEQPRTIMVKNEAGQDTSVDIQAPDNSNDFNFLNNFHAEMMSRVKKLEEAAQEVQEQVTKKQRTDESTSSNATNPRNVFGGTPRPTSSDSTSSNTPILH